jgi:hypothetical protein
MVCKADIRVYTGSGKNSPMSSGFYYCSYYLAPGVLVVGVTSFQERERILGLFEEGVCVLLS